MNLTIPFSPGVAGKSIGFDTWMQRVMDCAEAVASDFDADDVHDLRVALRRCRTMADALSEVNPSSGWRRLKKASRDLFHVLGELRNCQVEREWIKKLVPAGDPMRRRMLGLLARDERQHRVLAARALKAFDLKGWKKLARKLEGKAQFFPLGSVVFQHLAADQLNRALDLYYEARQRRSGVAWHRLRIALKRFRYVAENFLPKHYEAWAEDLKHAQDLLGDVHDLDVLRARIRRRAGAFDPAIVASWRAKIDAQRKACLDEFISKTSGPGSMWQTWRAGFPRRTDIENTSIAQRRTA